MATTTTAPTVIDAALTAFNVALNGAQAFESWPGPDGAPEMVVLGEVTWEEYDLSAVKTGRQHRQEEWSVGFEVFVFGAAGTTPADPKPARDRAFELASTIEDVLAANPKLGITAGGWVQAHLTAAGPRTFEKSWAYRVAGQIHVSNRLT